MFGLVNCYKAIGIDDYDWHVFAPDLRDKPWDYHTFDPKESLPMDKPSNRYRKVILPEGMETWFSPEFDAQKAGWKTGVSSPPVKQVCDSKSESISRVPSQGIWG